MKNKNIAKSTKKKYVEVQMELIDISVKDIITYSWDEDVPDDGWLPF